MMCLNRGYLKQILICFIFLISDVQTLNCSDIRILKVMSLSVRSMLFSSNPKKLCDFYRNYGLTFQNFKTAGVEHYPSLNSSLWIIEKPQNLFTTPCLGGLITYNLCNENHETFSFTPDAEKNLAYGNAQVSQELYELLESSTKEGWISILRDSSIVELLNFFKDIGEWCQEKHGAGPLHYALVVQDQVFEIYPERKEGSSKMEFIVPPSRKANDKNYSLETVLPHNLIGRNMQIEDLDGRHIRFMSE